MFPLFKDNIMDKEWDVLLETSGGYRFTLGLYAFNENVAKSKAKRLSKGCKVLGMKEKRYAGVGLLPNLKA